MSTTNDDQMLCLDSMSESLDSKKWNTTTLLCLVGDVSSKTDESRFHTKYSEKFNGINISHSEPTSLDFITSLSNICYEQSLPCVDLADIRLACSYGERIDITKGVAGKPLVS